jgi:hypothetical protein
LEYFKIKKKKPKAEKISKDIMAKKLKKKMSKDINQHITKLEGLQMV